MTLIGRLTDADPRTAWRHEAHDFTPWLAANLDQLGEAVGLQLEPEGTEVAVDTFAADILALDLDGNRVLIENQLAGSDHTHLGQILTYLAGLDVKTVIWVATGFRDAHLSAIKWLNDSTVDPFAFFAVRLRVVRIGDSAPAPIFDVLARPNRWERRMQKVAREVTGEASPQAEPRRAFWARYLERHPDAAALGVRVQGLPSNWLTPATPVGLHISIYRAKDGVGLFLRGPRGMTPAEVQARLAPHADRFRALVGEVAYIGDEANHPAVWRALDPADPAVRDEAIDWLHARARLWLDAITEIFGDTPA